MRLFEEIGGNITRKRKMIMTEKTGKEKSTLRAFASQAKKLLTRLKNLNFFSLLEQFILTMKCQYNF